MAAVQPPADALQLRRVIDRNNLTLRLSDLLSASTAAPAFFPPVVLRVGDEDTEFGDGGVTAHNNPALEYGAHGHTARLSRPVGHRAGLAPARVGGNP